MVSKNGSDLFITAEFPPAFKIDGKLVPVSNAVLSPQHTTELARALMNDKQAGEFEAKKELNFAITRRHRPLPGQRVHPDGSHRGGPAGDPEPYPEVRGTEPPAGARRPAMTSAAW
jgi:hypothetical protein